MGRESCKDCKYCTSTHWAKEYDYMCTMSGEAFLVKPSSVPPCLGFKPKPVYIPKREELHPSYAELRKQLEKLQEDAYKMDRELAVWMNSVNATIGLLRHKEAEISSLQRLKDRITGKKESE